MLYPTRQAQRRGDVEDWVLGEGPQRFFQPLDRRRYVLHALEGEDVIAFNLKAAVHDEAMGPRLVLDNASGRPLNDVWLLFEGYAYELGSVKAGERIERGLVRGAHGIEIGEASWKRVVRRSPGAPVHQAAPAEILLERKSRELRETGYPGEGRALLIGYTENPFRPAGMSAGWPRQEQALVAFQVAALPADAAPRKTGRAPREPVDRDIDGPGPTRMGDAPAVADNTH